VNGFCEEHRGRNIVFFSRLDSRKCRLGLKLRVVERGNGSYEGGRIRSPSWIPKIRGMILGDSWTHVFSPSAWMPRTHDGTDPEHVPQLPLNERLPLLVIAGLTIPTTPVYRHRRLVTTDEVDTATVSTAGRLPRSEGQKSCSYRYRLDDTETPGCDWSEHGS
jgi:hypothetical protein